MITKKAILSIGSLLLFIYSNSQQLKFFGRIEYSSEKLLPSGNYKEFQKTATYFNENSQCTYQIDNSIDVETLVAKQMKIISQTNEKYGILLDSFEYEKKKKNIKTQIEQKIKESNFSAPLRFTVYNSPISNTMQTIGKNSYCIVDTTAKIDWILLPDTMTIMGLFCQKARGLIFDNFYEVWFSPSISFPAGPTVMNGLPGIIVLATSEDKKRKYQLIKLEYPLTNPKEFANCSSEKVISRTEFFQLQDEYKKEQRQKIEELKKGKSQ